MTIYNPVFNEIRKLLTPIILKFIERNRELDSLYLHRKIKEMKGKDKEKRFELIAFGYQSDYSDQVQEVLVDMIRHCLIEERERGYKLTLLGKSFAKKDLEELEKMYD